jgi:hypothetical protein
MGIMGATGLLPKDGAGEAAAAVAEAPVKGAGPQAGEGGPQGH